MCIITISNTGIFCYSFLVVVLLMKYLFKTYTICSYNKNESFHCTHMLLKHVDSKIMAFLSSVLLCICSFTVVNIPSIRFPMLHVFRQFYACISNCLDKCTVCFVVRPVCMVHLSFMLYLLCRHLHYVSFRTVHKLFVYYISQYYGRVMSTYLSDSRTLINLFHLYIIFYFIFHSALKNATQTLPNCRRHNDTRFRNSNHSNILKIKCYHDLRQWYISHRFPSCCFCVQIDNRVVISILVFCLYYLSSTILIILIHVNYFFEKSLMCIRVCHLNRIDKMSLIIFRNLYLSIEFTSVVFLTPLHTEEYPFSVKYALYYIYFMKTHHSILYIVLINSYDHMFI